MRLLIFTIFTLLFSVSVYAIGPVLGSSIVCFGSVVTFSDTTTGGTWSSSNMSVATIGSTTGTVTGISTGTSTITYIVGASYATATITVNPLPFLSSSLGPFEVCDSSIFLYAPTSTTLGTTFNWARSFAPGILLSAGSGTGNINDTFYNSISISVPVVYIYTLTAGGCSDTQSITVSARPTPYLNSSLTAIACSWNLFSYAPTSLTAGTTFTWNRPAVAGISNPANAGMGNIFETLINTSASAVDVTYVYTLTIGGCSHTQDVIVTVKLCPDKVEELSTSKTELFPNPCNGSFSIYLPSDITEEIKISIINPVGQIVKELSTTSNTEAFIKLDAPAGVYFLIAHTSQKEYESKLIVR